MSTSFLFLGTNEESTLLYLRCDDDAIRNLTFIKYQRTCIYYNRKTWSLITTNSAHLKICRYLAILSTWDGKILIWLSHYYFSTYKGFS